MSDTRTTQDGMHSNRNGLSTLSNQAWPMQDMKSKDSRREGTLHRQRPRITGLKAESVVIYSGR